MAVDIRSQKQYFDEFLKIKTKQGKIIQFHLNIAQKRLYEIIKSEQKAKKPVRIIILKARQLGFSTLCEALLFYSSATREGVNSLIAAHREDSTANLFAMSRLFYEQMPVNMRPMRKNSNARELIFENPTRNPAEKAQKPGLRSRIRCATAGERESVEAQR